MIASSAAVPVSIGIAFDWLGGDSEAMLAMGLVVALPALALGLVRPARPA